MVRVGRDYRWDKLAAKFKAVCKASNALCHFCVERGDYEMAKIDYSAKRLQPWAFEADHRRSWNDHPQLRYEWSNLLPSHSRCNRQNNQRSLIAARVSQVEQSNPVGTQQVWVQPDW